MKSRYTCIDGKMDLVRRTLSSRVILKCGMTTLYYHKRILVIGTIGYHIHNDIIVFPFYHQASTWYFPALSNCLNHFLAESFETHPSLATTSSKAEATSAGILFADPAM